MDVHNVSAAAAVAPRAERRPADAVEMALLGVMILVGMTLNVRAFVRLIRQPRAPTALTDFLIGPYQMSSFVLFKMNLNIMDFSILLIHALGKLIWLLTYDWRFGDAGCKLYQFLSAFTYYGNSNLITAIAIDRLIVVYTSHIQGATSKRRVRLLLLAAWLVAAICALPQVFVWTSVEVYRGFHQCTTVWQVSGYMSDSSPSDHSGALLFYEMFHQSMVFWLPFLILIGSYLLIVVKVLSYTFTSSALRSASELTVENGLASYRKPSLIRLPSRLRGEAFQRLLLSTPSSETLAVGGAGQKSLPAGHMALRRAESDLAAAATSYCNAVDSTATRRFSAASMSSPAPSPSARSAAFDSADVNSLVTYCLDSSSMSNTVVTNGITQKWSAGRVAETVAGIRRKLAEKFAGRQVRLSPRKPSRGTSALFSRHFSQRQQKAVQLWRQERRSSIFRTSLKIVVTHCVLWLPYNLLNSLRFVDADAYVAAGDYGGFLLEDLIVLSAVVNPLFYADENRRRR